MIADFVILHRFSVLVAFLLLLALAASGLGELGLNPNNRVFFSEDDIQFGELLEFEADFDSNTHIVFAASANESLFNDVTLIEATRWLTEESWRIESVLRVDSISTYPQASYDETELSVGSLADFVCPENKCRIERRKELFQSHLVNRFVSQDGRTLAVLVTVGFDVEDSTAVTRINQGALGLRGDFLIRYPDLELHYTGAVPMMQAFMDASDRDMSTLMVVAVLVFIVLLGVFLGSVSLTVTMLALGMSSIVITMGIAGWLGHIVNTATAIVPLVIFTLVTAGAMHVFLHISRETSSDSETLRLNIRRAISGNQVPVFLTAITSVVGLLSMLFVSAPPIRQLGILSATGVVIGTLLLLTVVPAFLSFFSNVSPSRTVAWLQIKLNDAARKIENGTDRRISASLLFGICLLGLPFLIVDEDFVRYFDEESFFRIQSEAITDRLASPYHAEIVVDTGESSGIYAPEVIADVQRLTSYLRRDPLVANALSITDILMEIGEMLGNTSVLSDLNSDELAQYFFSFELALAKGQSATDFIDIDHRKLRLSILFADSSMAEIREFNRRVWSWIEAETELAHSVRITGEGIPTAYLSSKSISELSVGILVSLIFSTFLLGVFYRMYRIAIAILLAITVPVLAGFGLWGYFVGSIGMAATLVVAVTIGVVIDDSIHLIYRFKDSLHRLDLSITGAAAYALHNTGVALITTSVVLVGGFSVLMVSGFRMNSTFGICTALVITLALLYNAFLMPRILIWAQIKATPSVAS